MMLTLTINLPILVGDDDFEAFILDCNKIWMVSSNGLKINDDIREILEVSSGSPSIEYNQSNLDEINKIYGCTPEYSIFVESGREVGGEQIALWFANEIVKRWGGFIDFNGDERYENRH